MTTNTETCGHAASSIAVGGHRRLSELALGLLCVVLATAAPGSLWAADARIGAQAGEAAPITGTPAPPELRRGRELLQGKQFAQAKTLFSAYLRAHPAEVQAELGLGDAELGLREYETAELHYRAVVAKQPELWQAHKNLVVVEAELGRWDDFDGERKILQLARERGAPGISTRESDVIDSFTVNGERWVVRAYFEPVGRSEALYNFERFSPAGRVEGYISLENAAAAQAALTPGDVRIGSAEATAPASKTLALNWYTGAAHGTIERYGMVDPSYEKVRADVMRWLRGRPAQMRLPEQ